MFGAIFGNDSSEQGCSPSQTDNFDWTRTKYVSMYSQ